MIRLALSQEIGRNRHRVTYVITSFRKNFHDSGLPQWWSSTVAFELSKCAFWQIMKVELMQSRKKSSAKHQTLSEYEAGMVYQMQLNNSASLALADAH